MSARTTEAPATNRPSPGCTSTKRDRAEVRPSWGPRGAGVGRGAIWKWGGCEAPGSGYTRSVVLGCTSNLTDVNVARRLRVGIVSLAIGLGCAELLKLMDASPI